MVLKSLQLAWHNKQTWLVSDELWLLSGLLLSYCLFNLRGDSAVGAGGDGDDCGDGEEKDSDNGHARTACGSSGTSSTVIPKS